MTLDKIKAADTGVGPTKPGRWTAFDGDSICSLTATEDPTNGLVWTWDDDPQAWPETAWTSGWPCAPSPSTPEGVQDAHPSG